MEIRNFMEDMVKDVLDELLSSDANICKCEKCRLDIMAIALNNIKPKYVVTVKGRVYAKLSELEVQFRADVIRELAKAISLVKGKPQVLIKMPNYTKSCPILVSDSLKSER